MAAPESSGNETETDNEFNYHTPSKEPGVEFVPDEKPLAISRRSARLGNFILFIRKNLYRKKSDYFSQCL